MTDHDFLDEPPQGAELTAYDQAHLKLYLRLLDADAEGADWRQVAKVLFGLDGDAEPDRTRQVHQRHLQRARWMTQSGYRQLLRGGPTGCA